MQDLLSALFFVKKSKPNLAGEVPVYLRITYGKRAEMSVMRLVELSRWNAKGNRIEGNSIEIRRMNRHLEILREKVYQAHAKLVALDDDITAMGIKNVFLGKDIRQKYKNSCSGRTGPWTCRMPKAGILRFRSRLSWKILMN